MCGRVTVLVEVEAHVSGDVIYYRDIVVPCGYLPQQKYQPAEERIDLTFAMGFPEKAHADVEFYIYSKEVISHLA